MEIPHGLLLVDKPTDWTSFDVVNKVRGVIARELAVKPKSVKVGHSGTLDPLATGLLILAVGRTTKQLGSLTKLDKTYQVEATLGVSSDTGDREGELIKVKVATRPSLSEVKQTLSNHVGEIMQSPHKYSAIKINGVRAYKLARRGEEVKIEPRKVEVYQINDIDYDWPIISFTTEVSSGTYVRSLVEDVGKILGVEAYMSQLRRTKIGEYNIESAIAIDNLTFVKITTSLVTP